MGSVCPPHPQGGWGFQSQVDYVPLAGDLVWQVGVRSKPLRPLAPANSEGSRASSPQ